jgi:hypothetical protein
MNKLNYKRLRLSITILILFPASLFAQFEEVEFLRAGPVDGMKILEAYITPWANAFGASLNGSWYNTAKPHKFSGFDITAGVNFGYVPSTATTFDVTRIGLTTFTGTGMAPTVSGPAVDGPLITGPTVGAVTLASFHSPPGTNWDVMMAPTLQVGIGLPLGTELKIRYMPKIPVKGIDISNWGIGLVHSIMQYFSGTKLLPFDVSLFGGFNKLVTDIPILLLPDYTKPQNYTAAYSTDSWKNQNISIDVGVMNFAVIGSLNLPVLTVYGGLGYSQTKMNIDVTGNFPLPRINTSVSPTQPVYEDAGVLINFPSSEIKNFSGLRANIGVRIKLGVITFFGDYTRSNYNVVSAGAGISFR